MAGQQIDEYPPNAIGLTGQPGCVHCGAPRRLGERIYQFDKLVDEIVDMDGNTHAANVIVICEHCIVEIATRFGCLGPDLVVPLQNEVGTLRTQVANLHGALSARRGLNQALTQLNNAAGDLVA